jgi:hypothetical protein
MPSTDNRIWFADNPWPEGHPIEAFSWTAQLRDDGRVWCHFELTSAHYQAERVAWDEEEDEEPDQEESDWGAPIAWDNYEHCILSSTMWGHAGFPLCAAGDWSAHALDGMQVRVDPLSVDGTAVDPDDRAFGIYLLGHDGVADHQIRFARQPGTDRFDIRWNGRIALEYAGETAFQHTFSAQVFGIAMPALKR